MFTELYSHGHHPILEPICCHQEKPHTISWYPSSLLLLPAALVTLFAFYSFTCLVYLSKWNHGICGLCIGVLRTIFK